VVRQLWIRDYTLLLRSKTGDDRIAFPGFLDPANRRVVESGGVT